MKTIIQNSGTVILTILIVTIMIIALFQTIPILKTITGESFKSIIG